MGLEAHWPCVADSLVYGVLVAVGLQKQKGVEYLSPGCLYIATPSVKTQDTSYTVDPNLAKC